MLDKAFDQSLLYEAATVLLQFYDPPELVQDLPAILKHAELHLDVYGRIEVNRHVNFRLLHVVHDQALVVVEVALLLL